MKTKHFGTIFLRNSAMAPSYSQIFVDNCKQYFFYFVWFLPSSFYFFSFFSDRRIYLQMIYRNDGIG